MGPEFFLIIMKIIYKIICKKMGATCCDARSHITPGIDEMLKKDRIPSNESDKQSDGNMPAVEILI